ncbi:Phytocyanin domain - like 10 [Theobroma cacao]|uniref:Blue copper protein n=1 Tax=Theobroma cacao TaxID=3641 RepID=A0AB32V464_THECC|nr:PREDICTED: blue copper protein [Theobroma cacao]WRX23568.1 Phytocyanin domain - like 10 [Theobroma cacao]
MASNMFLMLTIVAMFLPTIAMATDYIVGDDSGWTINFDYQAWAKDKVFQVGDKLVFQYPQGYHNVFKVNGTAFKNCDILPENEALTSGNDTIVLKTPGRKWYICGVSNHCAAYGQKLAITVQYPYGWAPAPAPSSPTAPTPEPWAPTPEPWASTTPSVPATTTEPWAPAPQPWTPVPSSPSTPAPSAPWPPAPSPYPWI